MFISAVVNKEGPSQPGHNVAVKGNQHGCTTICILLADKVMLTHRYPDKPLKNIKIVICNHQVDRPLYLWPDVCSGDLQA